MAKRTQRGDGRRPRWIPSAEAAEREIRRSRRARYRKHRRRVFLLLMILALALGAVTAAQVLEIDTIHGNGMSPTLEGGSTVVCLRNGSKLLETAWAAGIIPMRTLRRGDVALFEHGDALLARRVVALGGDTVDLEDGQLTVNGEPVARISDLGDRVYPITVPRGRCFLLGDRESVAVDSRSRAFGYVGTNDVRAWPLAVIWPAFEVRILGEA